MCLKTNKTSNLDNVIIEDFVVVNNTTFHYVVSGDGLVWIIDPKTGTQVSVGQYRKVRGKEDAKQAAFDIITSSGIFNDYL